MSERALASVNHLRCELWEALFFKGFVNVVGGWWGENPSIDVSTQFQAITFAP